MPRDPRDLDRLEREGWFVEAKRWYQSALVLGDDGKTYLGRDVLPRAINIDWIASRMANAGYNEFVPGYVLSLIESCSDLPDGERLPFEGNVLAHLKGETGRE